MKYFLFGLFIFGCSLIPFFQEKPKPQIGSFSCDVSEADPTFDQEFMDAMGRNYEVEEFEWGKTLDGNGNWKVTYYCNEDNTAWRVVLWVKLVPGEMNPDFELLQVLLDELKLTVGLRQQIEPNTTTITPTGRFYFKRVLDGNDNSYSLLIINSRDMEIEQNLDVEKSNTKTIHIPKKRPSGSSGA